MASPELEAEQRKLEELRRRAIEEMRNNPTAVAERLRARGATEDQIAGLFANVGVRYPRVDVGQIQFGQQAQVASAQPAPATTVLPTIPIQPASVTHGAGAYTDPSGSVVMPTTRIVPASVTHGAGVYTDPSGSVVMPETQIRAGTPMTDDQLLRGNMYVSPPTGTVAGNK